MTPVVIYTDGACSGNPGPGGWGAVLIAAGKEKDIMGGESHTTNNRMEMMAAIKALEILTRPCKVELHTDSQYLRQGVTEWLSGWKARGWKTADKKPVKNEDLWRELDAAPRPPRGQLEMGQGPQRPSPQRAGRRPGPPGATGTPRRTTRWVTASSLQFKRAPWPCSTGSAPIRVP